MPTHFCLARRTCQRQQRHCSLRDGLRISACLMFVFLAGTSIYLQRLRGKSTGELSRFLFTRGLWLIVLEFTIVRFAIFFDLDYSLFGVAEVIWIFGISMILMAGMVWLAGCGLGDFRARAYIWPQPARQLFNGTGYGRAGLGSR